MEMPPKLPPVFQNFLDKQKRKKKNQLIIIIIVAIILFVALGYLGNKYPSITSIQNKQKNTHSDTAVTKQSPAENSSIDSTNISQTKPDSSLLPQLSKDDQETKGRYGVVSLEIYVKDNMNDPDSYQKISSDYSFYKTYFIVFLKFRGKNEFGGKVVNYAKAKTDLEGNIIQIIDTGY